MHTLSAHPPWCDPARCEAVLSPAGCHTSRPIVIGADEHSTARCQLRLWQAQPVAGGSPAPVLLEVVIGDHHGGRRVRVDLSIGQAGALRWNVGRLLDEARR